MAQQGFEEDLLRRWFPANAEKTLTPFTESDIREVADVLGRCARERWSRVPRLYSILRKIGQLDKIDAFIDSDITDVYFPFTKNTLPEALCDHSARLQFLELQHLVYNTKALELERQARHGHFSDPAEVPFKRIGELGKGGYGYVDRVVSTISHQEYARKLIPRGRTFKQNKQVLKEFTKELSNLKRLCHKHLVELVGSYTDKRFVALIMLPVADTNLQSFMERPDLDERTRSFLRPFFGCLTSALSYLHDNRIRHKDIKPSNILIKHDQVYFTDFGTSLDWSGRDNSTTETALPTTPRYCAPEVMAYVERNTASDIWSFGCVFLEMWTVLRNRTIKDLRTHMMTQGTRVEGYHSNPEAIASWITLLQQLPGPSSDLLPVDWISNMLRERPAARWNIHTIDNHIGEVSIESSAQHTFKGLCCLELEDETSEDSHLSDEDLESHIAPLLHPQKNSSCKEFGTDQTSPTHSQAVVGDTSTDLMPSKASDGVVESPCPPQPCSELEIPSPTSKTMELRVKEPSRESTYQAEKSFDQANDDSDGSSETPCSLPSSDSNTGNSKIESNRKEASLPAKTSSSSDDDSHTSAPPYQGLSPDSNSTNGNRSKLTQANNNQIPCLQNSDGSVSEHDTDSTLYSPNTVEESEAKTIKSYSPAIFPKSDPEKKAAYSFDRHARRCSVCCDPLRVYLEDRHLCVEGFGYAFQVLLYVCRHDGKVCQTTRHQYILEHDKLLPVSRADKAGSSHPRTIAEDCVQVESLLRAVERSMLTGASSVSKTNIGSISKECWTRLHMCVICKKPLVPWRGSELDVNTLSCFHQVHGSCQSEVDKLSPSNRRYCSLCLGSTPVVQEAPKNRQSMAASLKDPAKPKLKNEDRGDSASRGDTVTRLVEHDESKTRRRRNSSPVPLVRPPLGVNRPDEARSSSTSSVLELSYLGPYKTIPRRIDNKLSSSTKETCVVHSNYVQVFEKYGDSQGWDTKAIYGDSSDDARKNRRRLGQDSIDWTSSQDRRTANLPKSGSQDHQTSDDSDSTGSVQPSNIVNLTRRPRGIHPYDNPLYKRTWDKPTPSPDTLQINDHEYQSDHATDGRGSDQESVHAPVVKPLPKRRDKTVQVRDRGLGIRSVEKRSIPKRNKRMSKGNQSSVDDSTLAPSLVEDNSRAKTTGRKSTWGKRWALPF